MNPAPPIRLLELSRQQKIIEWLAIYGLHYNPFATSYSENDDYLTDHYVEHSAYLDNRAADSSLIFARSGAGKTATRLRLEAYFADSFPTERIFAFSLVLSEPQLPQLHDLTHRLAHILTAAADALVLLYCQHGPYRLPLPDDSALAAELASFLDAYASTSDWRSRYERLFSKLPPSPPIWDSANVLDSWRRLCAIFASLNVQHIVVMVDGFDEKSGEPSKSVAHMAQLALPFARAATAQELGVNTVFKLFLPLSTWGAITTQPGVNLRTYTISWGEDELAQLLKQRLIAASGGLVHSLRQLAEEDVADLDQYLIAEAGQSPRRLIYLANLLFETFVQYFTNEQKSYRISRKVVHSFSEHLTQIASTV